MKVYRSWIFKKGLEDAGSSWMKAEGEAESFLNAEHALLPVLWGDLVSSSLFHSPVNGSPDAQGTLHLSWNF